MQVKYFKTYYHIFYWILVFFLLILIFGRSWNSNIEAFYYVCLLLPVIMVTSYFFNYFLVPKFLLQKEYFRFILYSFYTIIVSLFLEMIVLIFTFSYRLQFYFGQMSSNASDSLLLATVMYLIVLFTSFLLMVKQLTDSHKEVRYLKENKEKQEKSFLQIISQRKSVQIPYHEILFIESYSDFIKVISDTRGEVISKEKISNIAQALPDSFLRIHRSFIVNKEKITRFDYNTVEVDGTALNIGRTYKKKVLQVLKKIKGDF